MGDDVLVFLLMMFLRLLLVSWRSSGNRSLLVLGNSLHLLSLQLPLIFFEVKREVLWTIRMIASGGGCDLIHMQACISALIRAASSVLKTRLHRLIQWLALIDNSFLKGRYDILNKLLQVRRSMDLQLRLLHPSILREVLLDIH